MKPHIPVPCPANWDEMKIGLVSRFCDSCQKDVMDFTQSSRHEILAYLIENRNSNVCARVYPSQLDYQHYEILVTIRSLEKKYKNTNLSFYLLTMATLSLMACESAPTAKPKAPHKQKTEVRKENIMLGKAVCAPPENQTKTETTVEFMHTTEYPLQGDMAVVTPPPPPEPIIGEMVEPVEIVEDNSKPRMVVDVMPEFPGGTAALMKFIGNSLVYPDYELQSDIQGTVYATFVIDPSGKVINPKILRSVPDSKNFDAEVIRVIKSMPDWKPGTERGIQVPVQYNLPFRFKLQ